MQGGAWAADGGLYQLLIAVELPVRLMVGRLGEVEFATGYYVYTGSARRALSHRLARHGRRSKALRWHIDYLTTAAPVVATRIIRDERGECDLVRDALSWPDARVWARGFGASDCRAGCGSHLAYLGPDPAAWPGPTPQSNPPAAGQQRADRRSRNGA